jgi:hypothetical protein
LTHRKTTGDSITRTFDVLTVGRYNAELWYTCPEADARATMIPAGIGGHKSNQMLDRLDKDVLAKKPDWMTLSCGVNDVWHGTNGVPLDAYQKNITTIVDPAQSTGIRVMLLTATMIREDASMLISQTISPDHPGAGLDPAAALLDREGLRQDTRQGRQPEKRQSRERPDCERR